MDEESLSQENWTTRLYQLEDFVDRIFLPKIIRTPGGTILDARKYFYQNIEILKTKYLKSQRGIFAKELQRMEEAAGYMLKNKIFVYAIDEV